MKWVKDREGYEHPELSAQEARQARPGRPVLYVLIGGVVGCVLGFGIAWIAIA
ncbi:MAG: hypothetical protein ACFCUQ_22680 [Kiloniellales bacterium]